MKVKHAKFKLFTLTCFLSLRCIANSDISLIEELPDSIRVQVHSEILDFLKNNPSLVKNLSMLGIDKNGDVYVLDETKEKICPIGLPSCGFSV